MSDPDLLTRPSSPETGTTEPLVVRLASPRGFCAGVARAIECVEAALRRYGAPIFVRHEIVHNTHVVRRLRSMGAVFIDQLDEATPGRPVIFSAHGVSQAVYDDAARRGAATIDATCPLVLKVHNEIRRWASRGYQIALVGHDGHPEVIGSLGQAEAGRVRLIETAADAETAEFGSGPLALVTQTTLSRDETRDIIAILRRRYPHLEEPGTEDICYATTNRQEAVKAIAPDCDVVFVVGDPHSSNSRRLVDVARDAGAKMAILTPDPDAIDLSPADNAQTIGVTSGASVPEILVERLLTRLAQRRRLAIEHVQTTEETISFKQPTLPALA